MTPVTETRLLIVGAGPIGIELAIAVKRAGVDYVQIEAGNIGQTISWYAPQTHFFSSPERIAIAGIPLQTMDQTKATREEYLNYLRAVVLQHELEIRTRERVTSLRKNRERFEIITSRVDGERRYSAAAVVLAIGDMHRPRLLGVAGEDLPHVSHYFAEPHEYFGHRVLIVGGRNSAVEAAIRCVRVGARVTLSYRGAALDADHIKFWLFPELRGMIADGRVLFVPSSCIREILPDSVLLETAANGVQKVETDLVLLLTGYEQDSELFRQAGVELEGPGRRPVLNPDTMESSVKGLYVAGTAIAGTQSSGVKEFIETTHVHVERILAALTGRADAKISIPEFTMPES